MSVRGRRRRQTAPTIQTMSTAPLPAATPVHPAALRRTRRRRRTTQAATWPQQAAPPPQGAAGGRPRSRCSDSCRAPPKLALYPLPALAQRTTHHDRPCKQASAQRVLPIIAAPTRAGRHSVIIAIETPIQNHCRERSDESLEEQSSREASGLSRSLKFRVPRGDSIGSPLYMY